MSKNKKTEKMAIFLAIMMLATGCGSPQDDYVGIRDKNNGWLGLTDTEGTEFGDGFELPEGYVQSETENGLVAGTEESTEAEGMIVESTEEVEKTTMYAQKAVQVYEQASSSSNKAFKLKENDAVTVFGKADKDGWVRISYGTSSGYCSLNSLGAQKVVKQETVTKPDSGSSTTKPDSGSSTTKPDSGSSTTKPDSGSSTTKPDSGSSTTKPDSGSSTTKPDSGSSTTKPDSGSSTTKPDSGSSTTKPDSGSSTETDSEVTPHEHDWLFASEEKEATCTEQGSVTYVCVECGASRTEKTAALGHDLFGFVVDKEATADEEGSMSMHCSRCGGKFQITAIPKLTE